MKIPVCFLFLFLTSFVSCYPIVPKTCDPDEDFSCGTADTSICILMRISSYKEGDSFHGCASFPKCTKTEDCYNPTSTITTQTIELKNQMVCEQGFCKVKSCSQDSDCHEAASCQNHDCEARENCKTSEDCGTNQKCKEIKMGNLLQKFCVANKSCDYIGDCSDGKTCIQGACVACTKPTDCPYDFDCDNGRCNQKNFCLPGGCSAQNREVCYGVNASFPSRLCITKDQGDDFGGTDCEGAKYHPCELSPLTYGCQFCDNGKWSACVEYTTSCSSKRDLYFPESR